VAGLVLVAPLAFPSSGLSSTRFLRPAPCRLPAPLLANLAPVFDRPMLEAHHRIMFSPDKPPEHWKANYPWIRSSLRPQSSRMAKTFSAVHPLRLDSYVDLDRVRAPSRC
jgi:hypothetical protein